MPPKRKPTAPLNRVYKSSTPLQQRRFSLRSSRAVSKKQASEHVAKQETLTQMSFVNLERPVHEDDEDLCIRENEAVGRNIKRRKTISDVELTASKYHTQTLTQIGNWSFTPDPGEADDNRTHNIMGSSPRSKELRQQRVTKIAKPQTTALQRSTRRKSTPGRVVPPQTTPRRSALEIPSSASPATPPSWTSPSNRSALRYRSVDVLFPVHANLNPQSSPSKIPKFIIKDTFESELSQTPPIPTTPSKRSSPAKGVRWAEMNEVHQIGGSFASTVGDMPLVSAVDTLSTRVKDEVMDSEDDDEDLLTSENDLSAVAKLVSQPEHCFGKNGLAPKELLENQDPAASPCVEQNLVKNNELQDESVGCHSPVLESIILGEDLAENSGAENTQTLESQRLATQHIRSMAPRTKDSDVFISIRPENVSKIVDRTKNHEFRRQKILGTVRRIWIYETSPTRLLQYMAVISAAKRPGELEIEDGIGNAEFNAKNPNCGEYAWEILELYELADPIPWATIRANEWLNGPPRKPTFVRPAVLDQLMANLKPALFYRMPLASVLTTESPRDTQEAEEQLLSIMKQYTQVKVDPEATSSQVINAGDQDAKHVEDDECPSSQENGDEEVDGQHKVDCRHPQYTTRDPLNPILISVPSSMKLNNHTDDPESYHFPYTKPSQVHMAPHNEQGTQRSRPTFSQAETVDLSQSQTLRHHYSTSDIIFESPTRPVFSSTPASLPPPRESANSGAESIIPYSLVSSQLLTKSQMLPESLLDDSVPELPLCIQDSDYEDGGNDEL